MTTQELIDELNKVQDKSKEVYVWNFEAGYPTEIKETEIDQYGNLTIAGYEI